MEPLIIINCRPKLPTKTADQNCRPKRNTKRKQTKKQNEKTKKNDRIKAGFSGQNPQKIGYGVCGTKTKPQKFRPQTSALKHPRQPRRNGSSTPLKILNLSATQVPNFIASHPPNPLNFRDPLEPSLV